MRFSRLINIVMLCFVAGGAARAAAQSRRDDLADYYLQEQQDNHSIYANAPVSHITPSFNTITYALSADYRNVEILPNDHGTDSLKLGGYTVTPYLAISLKRIGLGFTAESGVRTATYSTGQGNDPSANLQESILNYKAVGAFLYLLPLEDTFIPKWVTVSMLLGGRSYNAIHQEQDYPGGNQNTYNYNVNRYEGGTDVSIQLLKNFALIPWLDYTVTDAHAAFALEQPGYSPFKTDVDLFWFDEPRLKYGVDLAVHMGEFEIHLGDALGAVATIGEGPSQIRNSSYTLSIAFKQTPNK